MPESSPLLASAPMSFGEALARFASWCRREPLSAALLTGVLAVVIYFFCFYRVFTNGSLTAVNWAWQAWNAENDLEHGWAILPIALFVLWHHREELENAPRTSSRSGLLLVLTGVALFVLGVRALQPRLTLLALPVLGYGTARHLWGRHVARQALFPCAFLLFMVPAGFLVSRTVALQTLAATVAAKLSGLLGIGVIADGATLEAIDGSFHFEVAGGCSGIRSLMAMIMLAALYVHFTQRVMWKKLVIFGSSLVFALVGNLARIFTVVLFAKFINPDIAAGLYHDYSGFVFFPIAVAAMVSFSNLLNRDWSGLVAAALAPEQLPAAETASKEGKTASKVPQKTSAPASSYDY